MKRHRMVAVCVFMLFASAGAVQGVQESGLPSSSDIAEAVSKATLTIRCSGTDGAESAGSGFVVDPEGVVVTNYHVVHGCRNLQARMSSGDIFDVVRVHGLDPGKDIAIIRVAGFKLPTVQLGDSDQVRKGDGVLVVGSPLGVLEGSVSRGVISAVRDLDSLHVFQMDAAVSHGNSGGPVVDDQGKVVGVTSFKLAAGESLNFAIPINYVRGLLAVDQQLGLESLSSDPQANLFEKATAEESFPRLWKKLDGGSLWKLRVDGDYLYYEAILSSEQREAGWYSAADYQRQGEGWRGRQRQHKPCEWRTRASANYRRKICRFEWISELTLVTPSRIEGWTLAPPYDTAFNCEFCRFGSPGKKQEWIDIPADDLDLISVGKTP